MTEFNFDLGLDDTEAFVRQTRSFTLGDQLRKSARMYPDRLAVDDGSTALTYAELDARSDRLANALRDRGYVPGESTVAVLSENRGETVTLAYACAKLGCLLATLNWRLEREELVHCADLVTADVLFVSERFTEQADWAVADGEATPELVGYDGDGDVAYDALVDAGAATDPLPDDRVDPEQGFAVLNTSGTTGLPKGVVVSHRAILSRVVQITIDYGLERGDNYPAWGPMFHPAGVTWIGLTAVHCGTFYPIDGFAPERITDVVLDSDRPISWLFLVPGVVERLADHVEERGLGPDDFPEIRTMGALPDMIEPERIKRITELFDAPFQNTYGAAEDGHAASGSKIPVGVAPDKETLRKHETSLIDVKFIDERWNDSDAEEAEMAVRGPSLCSGYIRNPEANGEDFRDGWFRTGDVFERHGDGTYSFVSRRKYLIKPGGENVYPAELEEILITHDAVEEVVVVRADDPDWGEVPRAIVGVHDVADPDELRAELLALVEAELARYKLPHYIKFVDADEFGRSATGKIVRAEIEEWPIDDDERVREV
ncbi:class I adenylate-forming enzyme family protein [Halorarius litoreus]|uniref:class I adenylate-forming enzyme family protein n=1 Tax=Halorarius litoreus TaxID=2962676 RepID=UPI0020CE480D|nr:class I adenylate-forming enzyme family protein [Halorarius litoreus]